MAASFDENISNGRRIRELDAEAKALFRELPAGRELAAKWGALCAEVARLKSTLPLERAGSLPGSDSVPRRKPAS